jgi:Tfp pilus assembly protein PilE
MPRRKKNATAIEKLIGIAIMGILFSVVMPNLQRTQKRTRTAQPRRAAPMARQQRPEPAGRLNTIEVGENASRSRRTSPENVARVIGSLLRFVIVAAVALIVILAIRQGRTKRAEQ